MVKIRLRHSSSRRLSSQNIVTSNLQGGINTNTSTGRSSISPQSSSSSSSSSTPHFTPASAPVSDTRRQRQHQRQHTVSHSSNNSNNNERNVNRNHSTAKKVFHFLDSPRRALLKSTSRRKNHSQNSLSVLSSPTPTTSTSNSNQMQHPQRIPLLNQRDDELNRNMDQRTILETTPANTAPVLSTRAHDDGHSQNHVHLPNLKNTLSSSVSASSSSNVMSWLQDEAPHDIIPKVLSFAGPQMTQLMSRVNKSWYQICTSEAVFRTLCEDYGKWECGVHDEPMYGDDDDEEQNDGNGMDIDDDIDDDIDIDYGAESMDVDGNNVNGHHLPHWTRSKRTFWRNFYFDNPIVPLDYSTITNVLHSHGEYDQRRDTFEFSNNVRILVKPGIHMLENSINVSMMGDASFSIETLQQAVSKTIHTRKNRDKAYSNGDLSFSSSGTSSCLSTTEEGDRNGQQSSTTMTSPISLMNLPPPPTDFPFRASRRFSNNSSSRGHNLRQMFTCRTRSTSGTSDIMNGVGGGVGNGDGSTLYNSPSSIASMNNLHEPSLSPFFNQATIILKTKKKDAPIIHVTQGTIKISKVSMIHNCNGVDIWNGNTVVQIQPQFYNNRPIKPRHPHKMPNAIIEESTISSTSGRGIVAIDGGAVTVRKCLITKCAATGIYVGG